MQQHPRNLDGFTSFGCLRGAALTISPGLMVRALDLNLDFATDRNYCSKLYKHGPQSEGVDLAQCTIFQRLYSL
jgi:hypothetical protein